ncbi:MAG: 3-keto-5-aminohexanoate cleavage protein [Rhodospirillaceae bacterium]|nr:3-keto-5-aminohexanoate cleavage protein [Rhodospirillaceae bacterium]
MGTAGSESSFPPASPLAGDPPFAVMVAPNGARKSKADHPNLPISPAELAVTAAECAEAGAAAIHLHVRTADGSHSLDPALYRAALDAVGSAVGERLVVQITTEAVGRFTPAEQMATVRAVRPEWVSMAVREIAPSPADEPAAARFFAWMAAERIAPQFILYDALDLLRFNGWVRAGLVPFARPPLLFVLGRYTVGRAEHPKALLRFLALADPDDPWMVCAFGAAEAVAARTAALLGGHARVGFENNLCTADGRKAASNAALVAETVAAAAALGRRPGSADTLRESLCG